MRTVHIIEEAQPDGSVVRGFMCGTVPAPKICWVCGQRNVEFLCDAPIRVRMPRKSRSKTCDRPLCADCTSKHGHRFDYCPAHRTLAGGPIQLGLL